MKVETLPVIKGENNLPNYDEAYAIQLGRG